MKIVKLKLSELSPVLENPNKMKDGKFNSLVKTIEDIGYDQPMKVWWNESMKKYEIVKGNHRYWALRTLNIDEEDCVIGEYENRDEMLKDLVRDNVVKGQLDPVRFTDLFNKLSEKYQKEELKTMLGFADEAEFQRLYKEIRAKLPEEMQKKLDAARKEIKTIDDLSVVLNRIFFEHKDDLAYGFMVFSYSGKQVYWIDMDKELKKLMDEIAEKCRADNLPMSEMVKMALFGEEIKTGGE